jgi:hypothetical protein
MGEKMKKESILKIAIILVIVFLVYQFGVRPMFSSDYAFKDRKENSWAKGMLSKDNSVYDVVVVGSNPEGIAAAVSSARVGARTLLITEDEYLGDNLTKSLYTDFTVSKNSKGESINRGLVEEIYSRLGSEATLEKCVKTLDSLVKNEGRIKVVYSASLKEPVIENGRITGIKVSVNKESITYSGKMFIDATSDGKLLEQCKVPYSYGSGDLNLPQNFEPAALNFEMRGIDLSKAKSLLSSNSKVFYEELGKYTSSDLHIRVNDFSIFDEGNGKIIVRGIEVFGVDLSDSDKQQKAYEAAVKEAKDLAEFLRTKFTIFKNATFVKPADKLIMKEFRHFKGRYTLNVNDILSNRDFTDKIAMGAAPVNGGKLTDSEQSYIIGKPDQYSIPIGCIIAGKLDNLLMTGSKASYSSLASTSAGKFDVGVATGEACGVVAVYSSYKKVMPSDISKDSQMVKQLEQFLRRQGMYLPQFKIKEKSTSNWSFDAVKQLRNLGLIAGGSSNNYKFDDQATAKDIAMLLLNGMYRVEPSSFSLDIDAKLRKFFTKDKLTCSLAGKILTTLNDVEIDLSGAYEKACNLGYIDTTVKSRLDKSKDKILTMDEVYYLAKLNLKIYADKTLP